MAQQVQELVFDAAARTPEATALSGAGARHSYAALAAGVKAAAAGLEALGIARHDRVAVWLEPGADAVRALLGAAAAGAVMVPLDPAAGALRVAALVHDCGARALVTTPACLAALAPWLGQCRQLASVIACGDGAVAPAGIALAHWDECLAGVDGARRAPGVDSDVAALLYPPGDGGAPRGMLLSHRNLVAAAESGARCLGLRPYDRVLAALPLGLDFGFNQLCAAWAAGAVAVVSAQRRTRDLPELVARERISVLTVQARACNVLARLDWSAHGASLRCLASVGTGIAPANLEALRRALPQARIHLVYALAEAFRSTSLAAEQLQRRPGSIGAAVAGAELLVLRPDGRPCAPGEPGELVQRGPLVALGYWNDPQRTATRLRPLSPSPGPAAGEPALWSGETARVDRDGYLYLVRGTDDSIRTRGHRVSPGAVEEAVYGTGLVEEAAAVGVAHPVLGQVIALLATPRHGARLDSAVLFGACRECLPGHMLPAMVDVRRAPLPRKRNGTIDRARLAGELAPLFAEATS